MFTLADCALRNVNATTVAASRPPRPPPLSYPCLSRFPAVSDILRVSCSCGLRLAACSADCLHPADSLCRISEIPAVGFAVRFTKRGRRPAEKLRTKEIRDNCPNITNFLCQQTYITISTKYTGDNQPLKSLSLHL